MGGKLTISIDLELAWGFWDILTPEILRLSAAAERPICDKLLELFDRAVAEGFLREENRQLVLDDDDPERLLEKMAAFQPTPVPKWIGREER